MTENEQSLLISLKNWVYNVYLRANMVQLILLGGIFLILLLGSFYLLGLNQSNGARKEYEQQLISALQAKTDWLNARLASVQGSLQMLQRQTERMFDSESEPDLKTPLAYTDSNVLMKPENDGGVAVYYSTKARDLDFREYYARRLLPLNYLFADLQQANPLIKQVYLNTPDNLNLLYPYQDVDAQFAPDLDLTHFSFYYLADKRHNPQRQPVWTDAYLDPAGLGWIISHIAPVYKGDTLEAVVGLDLTIETLISNLFSLPQPWSGYAVLVGKDGNILALPPAGEDDFGLKELTDGPYSFRHLTTNEFKPELFNLYRRPEMSELSRLIAHQQAGLTQVNLSQPSVVAWNTVPITGWKLMAVTPQDDLYAGAEAFTNYLKDIALLVLLLMMMVFAIYFGLQKSRSQRLYLQMQRPLEYFESMVQAALQGRALPQKPQASPVKEIQTLTWLLRDLADEKNVLARQAEAYKDRCRSQNDYLRNLLNGIPIPVFDTDAEYRIQGCNRAFQLFFGKREDELRGHLLTEFIPLTPPSDDRVAQELILTNSEQQARPVSVVISRQAESRRGGTDQGKALIGLIIDLSEEYQVRDQMKFDRDRAIEASQLQTEYLVAMRRELEEPLLSLEQMIREVENNPNADIQSQPLLKRQLKEKIEALLLLVQENWLAESRPVTKQSKSKPLSPQAHVLVVDDGPVNTMLAKSALQKVGYDVDVVNSGKEALALMSRKSYQVVLMDIFMPEMDGIETTLRWREREKAMQLPPAAIIALTANVLESERQRFFEAGMNEYLAKPYHPSELRAKVDYWRQQYESGKVPG